MAGEFFKDYYKKLNREAFLKAFLCALFVGFVAVFISAAVIWFTGFKHFWISAIVFAVVVGAITPLLYFKKFKPGKKDVAKRVDELGLEERMLTMHELEGQTSFIAVKQREDALSALKTVNAGFIKLAISLPLIIAVIISGVFGVGMTTVSALSATEAVPPGSEVILPGGEDELHEYEVIYEVQEGGEGEIFGLTDEGGIYQLVIEGMDAAPVIAIPEDGYVFEEWSDGWADPVRQDRFITGNVTVYAIFAVGVPSEGEQEGEEEGDEGNSNKPSGSGNGESNGQNNSQGSGAGGGKYEPSNQVIDGETFYGGETFKDAFEQAVEESNNDGNLTDEDKDNIGGYLEGIRK